MNNAFWGITISYICNFPHNICIQFAVVSCAVIVLPVLSTSIWFIYPYNLRLIHLYCLSSAGEGVLNNNAQTICIILGLYCTYVHSTWWRHQIEIFPRCWPFVRGIHRLPVNSPHKGQWREVLILSLICAWTNGWVNNRDADDLRRHRAHYDVTLMLWVFKVVKSVLPTFCLRQRSAKEVMSWLAQK